VAGFANGCSSPEREFDDSKGDGGAADGGSSTAGATAGAVTGGAGEGGSEQESCEPGATEACYASADGRAYQGMPAADQTTCRLGERSCGSDKSWGACVGAIGPKAADTCDPGNDANCNGRPNEGCACDEGEKRACAETAETCPAGEQACDADGWGACEGEVKCEAGSVCGDDGATCKLVDGEVCSATADCATSACTTFFLDADKDTYRANAKALKFCGATKTGYIAATANEGEDCDDDEAAINPGTLEDCDGIDNDCDGKVDLDDDAGLVLSGQQKQIANGRDSSVASSGAAYGIAYGNAGRTHFRTLSQGNAVGTELEVDTELGDTGIAWGDDSFGIFYKTSSGVFLRKVTPSGVFTPANGRTLVRDSQSAASDGTVAHIEGGNWLYSAWGAYASANWIFAFSVASNGVPGKELTISDTMNDGGGRYPSVAQSEGKFGIVWHYGLFTADVAPQGIKLSVLDSSGAPTFTPLKVREGTYTRRPVIAPRAGGGFGVLYNEASTLYFEEFSSAGESLCERTSKGFIDFEPQQMVQTNRGYLAVSGYNKIVKAQEILSGCTFGTSFPKIGSGTETISAHIAAGDDGFAVVWDDGGSAASYPIYSRTFGPNLCD
jgi:hypothetical protein